MISRMGLPRAWRPGRLRCGRGYIIRSSGKASVFGDTWLWNGDNQTWTKQKPATRPPSRWDASMAYDLLSGHVILFGGLNTNQARTAYGDTWVWRQLGP